MKKLLLSVILLFSFYLINAQEKYSKVKILLNDKTSIETLAKLGIETDHGFYEKLKSFTSDYSQSEILLLKKNQIDFEILIDDVSKYYIERNRIETSKNIQAKKRAGNCKPTAPTYVTPNGFNLGSMGGFFTYQEAMNKIDSLAILYPNIVSIKKPIGNYTTFEGDSIFWLKISDNPNTNEAEPQMLYDAVHHAREPLSLSQLIYYMYYLCENYSSNSEIKYLVDNIEMYFVPIVNPDGYKYNEQTNPFGGGMWRKNRRDNFDGSFGVDINRNYGTGWGFNNTGSSAMSSAETYRGTAGFSEPEIQAMRDFSNAHNFRFAMNYHTYSNLIVYPWGYLSKNCDDSVAYREICSQLSKYNFYKTGTDMETVGYSTNGSSDDWMYGDVVSKPLIYAMTPEVGNVDDGFWPMQNRIIPLCEETNYMNITIAKYLLKHAVVENQTPRLTNNINGSIKYNIKRLGLENPATFTVSLTPLSSTILSVGNNNIYTNLSFATTSLDSISYVLQNNIPNNTIIKFALNVSNGQFTNSDTITLAYGTVQNILTDSCNNFANWNNSGWAIDNTTSYSSSSSFAENSSGKYSNNDFAEFSNTQAFNLTNAERAEMTFRMKYELENNYDYVQLMVSENNGATWNDLCAPHTQIVNDPFLGEVYTGVTSNWMYEIVNLDDYIGKNIFIKWIFNSDQGLQMQGYNLDDITVNKLIKMNVGVAENNINHWNIYPNPANDILIINRNNNKESIDITLSNSVGQKIIEKNFNAQSLYSIDLHNIPSGIYFVEINTAGQKQIQKLVIQK